MSNLQKYLEQKYSRNSPENNDGGEINNDDYLTKKYARNKPVEEVTETVIEKPNNDHTQYYDTESGLSRFGKITGKSIFKGLGEAVQSPVELFNLAKYLGGEKDPNEIKTEQEKQFDEDWPMSNQFSLKKLQPLPYIKPELDEKFGKQFERSIGKPIEATGDIEKPYSNFVQEATSWLSPGLILKALGKAGNIGGKAIGSIPKVKETAQKISSKIPSAVKEVGETAGNIGKGLYDAFYKAPSLGKIATASSSGKLARYFTEDMDDDSAWKRAAKVASPIVGNFGLNKGFELGKGKLHKGLIDQNKLDLVNKTGVPVELSQVTNSSHALTPFLANAAQNIMETPGARIELAKNREKLLDTIAENLGIENFDIKRSEDATKLIRESYDKYTHESILKSKKLENKALGKINTSETSPTSKTSFTPSAKLNHQELQDRVKAFWLNASPDLKPKLLKNKGSLDYKVLDDFILDSLNKKDYTFDADIDGKREKIKISLSPDEDIRPLDVRPSHTQSLMDQNKGKEAPRVVTKFGELLEENNGYVPFNDLHEYRKDINQLGNSKWARAAKTDVMNFLDTLPPDRRKSYEKYLSFNNERLSGGKKAADQKFNKAKSQDSETQHFEKIFKDAFGDNLLTDRYLKHLSPQGSKKVLRELIGALAFDPDTRAINYDRALKTINNLTEERFNHLSKIHGKAFPNSNMSLRELIDLIEISRATHGYSKGGIYSHATTGKNFMFNTIPEALASSPAFLAGNYKGMGKLANVFGKILGPLLMGKITTDQLLLNQNHIKWINKGNNIKNWGEFNSWLNHAKENKLITITDTYLIKKMIEDKKKENEKASTK